jgi:hypothetical protein
MAKSEANYEKPASQLDLEYRLKNGNASSRVLSTADVEPPEPEDEVEARRYAVEGNKTSNYFGVSPEYQTYANETEKPMRAQGGPEAELEKLQLGEAEEQDSPENDSESEESETGESETEEKPKTEASLATRRTTKKAAASE